MTIWLPAVSIRDLALDAGNVLHDRLELPDQVCGRHRLRHEAHVMLMPSNSSGTAPPV